jgi:hypothetical protein
VWSARKNGFLYFHVVEKNSKQGDFPSKNTGVGLPFPSAGKLPYAGIKHMSVMSPILAGGFFTISATWEALMAVHLLIKSSKKKANP